jgi:membrane fusion protein, multidrug efflux system
LYRKFHICITTISSSNACACLCAAAFICFALAGAGCGSGRTEDPGHENTHGVFPVEVTRAVYADVEHSLQSVGSFLSEEDITVSAEVAGAIKRLHTDEGAHVRSNDLLLEIDDAAFLHEVEEKESMMREAEARLENSRRTLQRSAQLYQDQVIGRQEYDEALTQVALNTASLDALRARLRTARKELEDTKVTAPSDGIVSRRYVAPGEYVKVGAELFAIVVVNPIKLSFSLPEKDAAAIAIGQKVRVTTSAWPGEQFTGDIYFISPTLDVNTRTLEVKARVDNPDLRLKPGFYASVTLLLAQRRSLVLPESAVVVRDGETLAMVVEDDIIVYKTITPGMRFDGRVEILSGISDSDLVVTSGRSEITRGSTVTIANRP